MSATRAAPVAMVFSSKASETFPEESLSAMMPDPTTAASKKAVPIASAISFFVRVRVSFKSAS
jgi:hypothetical protein